MPHVCNKLLKADALARDELILLAHLMAKCKKKKQRLEWFQKCQELLLFQNISSVLLTLLLKSDIFSQFYEVGIIIPAFYRLETRHREVQ